MAAQTVTFTERVVMHTLHCANCAILFAMPDRYDDERREDHRNFYCPNGHANHYPQKTKAEREAERADKAERALRAAEARVTHLGDQLKAAERQQARVRNGVCPCCNRTFMQLGRHMKTQHPEYVS